MIISRSIHVAANHLYFLIDKIHIHRLDGKLKEKDMHNALVCCRSLIIATFIHLKLLLAFPEGKAGPQVSVYANSAC